MATNIPPHNLSEVCEAAIALSSAAGFWDFGVLAMLVIQK